jgi:hypothetical protein
MLSDILKSPNFNTMFSFLLGVGLICIIKPTCKGDECAINKAPAIQDFDNKVFFMNGKCYEFKTNLISCPSEGAIEPFKNEFSTRESFLANRR